MTKLFDKRRAFVNKEVAIKLKGKKTTRAKTAKVFRQAWKKAKRKYKK